MKQLTQKRLKELLHYDPRTGVFIWLETGKSRVKKGMVGGFLCHNYRRIIIRGRRFYAHRLAWLYVHGYFPENEIDHINRDKTNNILSNLRVVPSVCNKRNTGNHATNTSGVKGVVWAKMEGHWKARIQVNGRSIHIGCHKDFTEAVCLRLAGEQALKWDGCDSSSPAFKFVQRYLASS